MMQALTQVRLQEVLSYDPIMGEWTWLIAAGPRVRVGDAAGNVDVEGYRRIKIDGKTYRSGRLAWFYMTGKWPKVEVDHDDTDAANDRWENLRLASRAQNQRNTTVYSNNLLGVKGVGLDGRNKGRPFRATIRLNGKRTHLGSFATIEDASAAYAAAAEKHFGEFARAS